MEGGREELLYCLEPNCRPAPVAKRPKERKERNERSDRGAKRSSAQTHASPLACPLSLARRVLDRLGGRSFLFEKWLPSRRDRLALIHQLASARLAPVCGPPRALFVRGCGVCVGVGAHYESSGSARASKMWTQQERAETPVSSICYPCSHNFYPQTFLPIAPKIFHRFKEKNKVI